MDLALSFSTCVRGILALDSSRLLLAEQLIREVGAAVRLLGVVVEKELIV